MKWTNPREQKRGQVIKTALVALISDLATIYIFIYAPGVGVHTFFVPVISIISTVYTRIEFLEYRNGRYRIWPD